VQIQNILKNVEGVAFVYLEKKDVVRHRLVKDIINAYEEFSVKTNGIGNSVNSGKTEVNGNSEKDELNGNNNDENGK
jgi:hypothetical protein